MARAWYNETQREGVFPVKKIVLVLMMAATLMLGGLVGAGAETGGDYGYWLLNDGTVEITGYTWSANITELIIPDELAGYRVTSIGEGAFAVNGFLTDVTIPDSVTTIGVDAFFGCTSLSSVTIPDFVTTIGDYAFGQCHLLTSIAIPRSVTALGANPFYCCYRLADIQIPAGHPTLANIRTALIDKTEKRLICYPCASTAESYAIPQGVRIIGENAFNTCGSLTTITIPDSVTVIEPGAFGNCFSLTSINLPDSVTDIGDIAFAGCASLTSLHIPASVTSIASTAFIYCPNLTLTVVPGTEGERYAQERGIPYQYGAAAESAPKQDAQQAAVTDGVQEDGLSNLRMMLLSADTSYGGVLYYYVYNDQVYVDAARLARLRNSRYDEGSRTFTAATGVTLGTVAARYVLPDDAGYVRLDKAADVLYMTFAHASGGRVSIHAAATPAELRALCTSIQENEGYRLYRQAFDNGYYTAAQYGYEGLNILLSGDPVGGLFGKITGNDDQKLYNKAFETMFVNSSRYKETMELAEQGESAIIEPLRVLRYLEKACNEEDGALAELMKSMGVSEGEISVVLGEWSKSFYELVYANGVSSSVLTMAEVYEALDDLYLADLAKEVFAVINLASAVAEMDELTVIGMEQAFLNSKNMSIAKGADKIVKIYASSAYGGTEAVIRAFGDDVFEGLFDDMVGLILEGLTGSKALSVKQKAVEATLGVLKKTVLKEGTEEMDQFLLNTAMCHIQEEAFKALEKAKDDTPGALRKRQAAAAVYLRTVIAICENGQMGSDKLKYEAQAQFNRLMSFDQAEYGKSIDNQAFIDALLAR